MKTSAAIEASAAAKPKAAARPAAKAAEAAAPKKKSGFVAAATRFVKNVTGSRAAKPKAAPKTAPTPALPSILLEGDDAPATKVSGPGERFALGPTPPVEHFESAELPAAYGTKRLMLTARDPQWLYAHWDLTDEQLRKYNSVSTDKHLVVRVYANELAGSPVSETHVHPESRNWFIHVGKGGAKFLAELGYYAKAGGKWVQISTSKATLTPPDTMSDDTSVRFATIPVELSFQQLLELIKTAVRGNVPLVEAIQQLRATGYKNLPDLKALESAQWTPAQERALAEIVSMDAVRRVWMGSLEITELLRRQMLKEISSQAAAMLSVPGSLPAGISSITSLASPFGGMPGRKGFWFMVNAELIIYGATEPDATVTIGGRKIKLRGDGTFSYRFALPDGQFNLPAIATNADGDDTRMADLAFSRSTEYSGEVGKHPQDAALKPPTAEHVA
ncbi:MAG TPA: DUF4912 domain-containing protein [Verrucomicrobiae bacterium]|jgi:hypothetical protein